MRKIATAIGSRVPSNCAKNLSLSEAMRVAVKPLGGRWAIAIDVEIVLVDDEGELATAGTLGAQTKARPDNPA